MLFCLTSIAQLTDRIDEESPSQILSSYSWEYRTESSAWNFVDVSISQQIEYTIEQSSLHLNRQRAVMSVQNFTDKVQLSTCLFLLIFTFDLALDLLNHFICVWLPEPIKSGIINDVAKLCNWILILVKAKCLHEVAILFLNLNWFELNDTVLTRYSS